MLEQGKIDSKQAVMLMMSLILPTAILTVPAFTVKFARQDAWLSGLAATLAGLLIVMPVVSLSLRFPGKTLFEYAEEILGRAPGKIAGFLYIWWFLHTNALVMREFGTFLVAAMMPDTPEIVFHIVSIAVIAYMVRGGLEVVSRFNQLYLFIAALMVIVFLLSAKDMKLVRVLPVFDAGLVPVLKGAATPVSWLGEIVTFAMIIPCLNKPGDARRVAFLSILLSGLFLTASILESLLIFGPDLTAAWIFPTFSAVRTVSIANFLERLESVVLAAWLLGGFVKMGIFYYAAVLGSAQWLGLRDYRPLVAPVGVILVGLAMLIHERIVDLLDFLVRVWPPYALVFEAGIPLALLIVALAGRKGGKAVD